MTDAIEIALISDNNDQINSVAVWDIRNGTTLMQYRGKYFQNYHIFWFFNSSRFRWWSCRKTHSRLNQWKFSRNCQQREAALGNLAIK